MPLFLGALLGGLADSMGSFIGRALIGLSLGFVTYIGFDALVSSILSQINSLMQGFTSSSLAAWGGFFQIDKHVSMVLSAVSTKIMMKGLQDGKKHLRRK